MKKLSFLVIVAMLATACSTDSLTKKEREAMAFMCSSLPLCDLVDYSQDYYSQNIKASFKAKEELPWGEAVPEREFKHFVLPIRVNNENLDDFRMAYYEELRDRVKDLSMYDAVLEVNHWCHEKVSYKGSDSRTSAPMATIKTSWGRCGEESTLLVTALRTVCIPARQVYTPRWAHCDDNHAWVEAWVDGEWHFLGACEPEPVLDLGWFNAPASRTLLVHTRVFGDYDGPEEVISKTANYTEINVVDNYAKTAQLNVKVVDNEGDAVADANVDFKIYNYSEYCTVATKRTDSQGNTWLTAGLGTMMVYASKDGKFGFEVVKIGSTDTLTVHLCKDAGQTASTDIESYDFNIIPPAENAKIPDVSAEMRIENNRRLAIEDSIRNDYVSKCSAAQNDGDYNPEIMAKSWGNYQTIKDFVDYARGLGKEEAAYKILNVISDKDLRDVTIDVLIDCLPVATDANPSQNDGFYYRYVVNPRVSNEMLRPHRADFEGFVKTNGSLSDIVGFVRDSICICDACNERRIPISPAGVMRMRKADSHSRDIFFVALARAAGIPSRIDPVTGNVQYHDNDVWNNVVLAAEDADSRQSPHGTLRINYKGDDDPRYYSHFSIKKFNGGTFDLLSYDALDPGMDVGLTLSQMMTDGGLLMEPGYYVMSSGPRLDDGSVLNHLVFFTIEAGRTADVELVMRSVASLRKGERVVAYLDGGSEPTTHAMIDISILKEKFERWGGEMTFYFKNQDDLNSFKLKKFNDLPSNVVFGINNEMPSDNLPVIMVIDDDDNVLFESKGYKIGLAEQILRYFPT